MAPNERRNEVKIGFDLLGSFATLEDPTIRALQDCIKNKQWFAGIVYATTFLEHFGFQKLEERYHKRVGSEELMRLNLGEIAILLFASGIIDESTYVKMREIIHFRNKVVHGRFKQKKALLSLGVNPKEAERLLKQTIECLGSLGVH